MQPLKKRVGYIHKKDSRVGYIHKKLGTPTPCTRKKERLSKRLGLHQGRISARHFSRKATLMISHSVSLALQPLGIRNASNSKLLGKRINLRGDVTELEGRKSFAIPLHLSKRRYPIPLRL